MQVGELWVKISGRNEGLKASMSQAEEAAKKATERLEKSSTALLKTVTVAATAAAAAITAIGVKSIEAAANSAALNSQFKEVFGDISGAAEESMNAIANETGMLPNRLKGSFVQISAFAKTTGLDTAEALALTERATMAAADSAAFYDKSIESVTETLQSYLKGNYENDAALGISSTETTRNAAANKLYGQSFMDLSEAQKQLTLLAMVEDGNKLSGALGQAAREADSFENQMGNLKQGWTDFMVAIGEPLLEPAIDAIKRLSEHLTTFKDLVTEEGLAGAIEKIFPDWLEGTIAAIAGAITVAMIPAFMGMATAAWAAVAPLLPFLAAGAAIGALAYVIIKNWEPIKGFFLNLWNGVVEKWNGVKTSVLNLFNETKTSIIQFKDEAIQWGRDLVQGFINGIEEKIEGAKTVASNLSNSIKTTIGNIFSFGSPSKVMIQFGEWVAEGLAKGIQEKTSAVEEAAQKMAQAITGAVQTMNTSLTNTLDLTIAKLDLEAMKLSDNATETEKLNIEVQKLNAEKDAQLEKIDVLTAAYDMAKDKLGENNETTRQYAYELQMAQVELQKIEVSIKNTTAAIENQKVIAKKAANEQAQGLRDLADEVTAVEKKYRDDLTAALNDYQRKVAEVNEKLIQDEWNVTEQYRDALASRAESLSNFVGLFDQVSNKNISGASLLANLQGQVDAFEDWSENIADLASRGVNEGLLEELREMGPKAGPEIAALNTLTDDQLKQYVSLWKEKNQMARQEASTQMEQQRREMEQKLQEIRADAAEQLEQYRIEWEKKNAEIRKNAEEEMGKIKNKFKEVAEAGTVYGIQLMANFTSGMESQFDNLRRTLEEAASIVDSYMPHSPAKVGPLKRLGEWGPALVKTFADGIRASFPRLESVMASMAMLTPAALGPSVSNNSAISNNYGNNVFHITVTGGNSRDQADNLIRELAKRGVKF